MACDISSRQILIKQACLFLLASLCLSFVVYRDALWGGSLLAPLDLGPTLFKHYKFMDPGAGQVPENHHIIDQFTYDLPLQKVIYDAYHSGEIPWWDPWTYGGRPLLADAHVNGTDPIRLLCYALLPFELAYNWNFVLRGLLTGLGMFLLLRHLRIEPWTAGILALTYQFAGWFTGLWGHPWVQGAFVYYPLLWICWSRAAHRTIGWADAAGAVLCALVFYAGNLQSHAYLPIFAGCMLFGVVLADSAHWRRALRTVVFSGATGAMLAAPVLANQVEFFLLGTRASMGAPYAWKQLMAVPGFLLSVYPWPGGSFKTLDFTRAVGCGSGFTLFCGGAISILGIATIWRRVAIVDTRRRAAWLIAAGCFAAYFLVACTPLQPVLYTRIAPLAGMGIVVAAGISCGLPSSLDPRKKLAAYLRAGVVGIVLLLAAGTIILPRAYAALRPRVENQVVERTVAESGGATLSLRRAQLDRYPAEISLRNPEVAAGLLAIGFALTSLAWCASGSVQRLRLGALSMGLLSTLIHHDRFRPKHDIALWHRLLDGGPAQLAARTLAGDLGRVDESTMLMYDAVLPNALPAFYKIHAVHGYSALQPPCLFRYPADETPIPEDWRADYAAGGPAGLSTVPGTRFAFMRDAGSGRGLAAEVQKASHNRLELYLGQQVPDAGIITTSTRYPGWSALSGEFSGQDYGWCFTLWKVGIQADGHLDFAYLPTHLEQSLTVAAAGFVFVVLVLCLHRWRCAAMPR